MSVFYSVVSSPTIGNYEAINTELCGYNKLTNEFSLTIFTLSIFNFKIFLV